MSLVEFLFQFLNLGSVGIKKLGMFLIEKQ